jgi:hypothetical protein
VLEGEGIALHVEVVSLLLLGELDTPTKEAVQGVVGVVIGELVCQVLLSVLPAARHVRLDVLLKLWYLEMEGHVEEPGYFIVPVILGGKHQVQLRGGGEQHVIYVLEKGEMCDLLLRGYLVRLKYLHAVLDLRLRKVLREKY